MTGINILLKITIVTVGCISLILGVLGIFLPLLPTTPLILLSAACFSKGSDKLYAMLMKNRFLGNLIRNYKDGKGIPLKIKILALLTLWLTIVYSVCFLLSILFVRLLLVAVAIGVTIHILSLKTAR